MTIPGQDCSRIALFCTAVKKPSVAWLNQACHRAYSIRKEEPLVLVEQDEVDTTSWTYQQVAEWVVANLAKKKDDRGALCFVIADDTSEETDSLVIVTLKPSALGLPDPHQDEEGDFDDFEADFEEEPEMVEDIHGNACPNMRVKDYWGASIDRAFRASPEFCSSLPSLINGDVISPWDFESDNPEVFDSVYRFPRPSAGMLPRRDIPMEYISTIHHDKESKEHLAVTNQYVERICRMGLEPAITIPCYRLANGKYLSTMKVFGQNAFDKEPFPQVDLGGEFVTVLGRSNPVRSLGGKL